MSLDLTLNEPQINLETVNSYDQVIYEFHNYRLDAGHLMLYRGKDEISLTPKQVETLLALVEKNGEIVSKDVLMQRLWGDTVVEEANLTQNIHFLRKELGNAPDGKPLIETLRRRGYRFTADVNTTANGKPKSMSVAGDEADAQHWYQERPVAVSLAIFGLLGLAVFASSFLFSLRSTPVAGRTQFAVLPIRPIDLSNRSDLYENGIADALINRINSIDGFQARPLAATQNYSAIDQDPLAFGREQRVDYVLASSYQVADGRIRITAQLVNITTGETDDSFTFENPASNVFAIQDAAASEFANRLIARFNITHVGPVEWRGTNNEEAYRLYLQGMNLYNHRKLKAAGEAFEESVRLDPNYARAWAGLAHAARIVSRAPSRPSDADGPPRRREPEELRIVMQKEHEKAIDAISKALALDPGSADAYSAWCEQKTWYEWDFRGAESICKRAVELDPRSALAHQNYSGFLIGRGRFDEAIAEIKVAIDLEPASPFNQRLLGDYLVMARQYTEAESQYRRLMETDPNFAAAAFWLSMTFELNGKEAEAFEYWIKDSERRKDETEATLAYKLAYQKSGWQGVLRERAARFEESGRNYFQGAAFNALLNNKDRAFEYLELSFANREWNINFLEVDPRLDSLRDDPRFDDLVRRFATK